MRAVLVALVCAVVLAVWPVGAIAQPAASCLPTGACDGAEVCKKADIPTLKGYWAFALSWQPGFCETRSKDGCPVECQSAPAGVAFSLHGLWPQWAEYCGVPTPQVRCACGKVRSQLPAVTLSADVEKALAPLMPGKQSLLDRHEWIKHGTCSGMSQDDYFATAAALTEQANQSGLGRFIADNVGKSVTYGELCKVIETSFGPKAAKAVEIEQSRVDRPDGTRVFYLTGFFLWLKPVNDKLALSADNFVAIDPDWMTLGGGKARPMCAQPATHAVYIDRPGLGQ